MRKFIPVTFVLTMMLFFALFGSIMVEPVPAYAQDVLPTIPDLSGINIYFSEAYAEMSQFERGDEGISRYAGLLRLAGANLFTLEWRKGIPADADLIIIPNPSSDITSDDVARLWSYLQRGGKVLLIADAFDNRGNVTRALGTGGLFALTWADLGIQARSDVIVAPDGTQEIEVTETDRDGEVIFEFSGDAPVLSTEFYSQRINEDHPITGGIIPLLSAEEGTTANLNSIYFDGARSLEIDSSIQDFNVTPLIFTDIPDIYGETDYTRYMTNRYSEYNIGTDSQQGDLILAAAYDDRDSEGRMILIGDGDIVRNGAGFSTSPSYSGSFVYPLNVQFMLRSTVWLLDQEPTILDLPTPAATATATITPSPTPSPVPTETPEGEGE